MLYVQMKCKNNLINVVKISSGELKINIQPTLVITCATKLYSLFKFKIAAGIEFTLHILPNVSKMLLLDERRYKQIVLNLLSNSSKFTIKGYIKI